MAAQAVAAGTSSLPQTTVGHFTEWKAERVALIETIKQLLRALFTNAYPGAGKFVSRTAFFADAVSGDKRSVMLIGKFEFADIDALPETVRMLAQQIAARNGYAELHNTICCATRLGVVGNLADDFELVAVRILPRHHMFSSPEHQSSVLAELDAVHDSLREHAVPGVALPMSRFVRAGHVVSAVSRPTRPIQVLPLMLGSLRDYWSHGPYRNLHSAPYCWGTTQPHGNPPKVGAEKATSETMKKELFALSQPLLATLQTLHDHDIVHGNLHEGNVLFASDGKLLLTGLYTHALFKAYSNYLDASRDCAQHVMSTHAYIPGYRLAPEMNLALLEDPHKAGVEDVQAIRGLLKIDTIPTVFTPASDVWHLGAMLFNLATGTELYSAGVPLEHCAKHYPALRRCSAYSWFCHLRESKVLPTVIKDQPALTRFVAGLTRWEVSKRYSAKFAALLLKMLRLYKEQTAEVAAAELDAEVAAAWAVRMAELDAEASEASA